MAAGTQKPKAEGILIPYFSHREQDLNIFLVMQSMYYQELLLYYNIHFINVLHGLNVYATSCVYCFSSGLVSLAHFRM